MMLEAPPAAAMRYVKDWRGLDPSEYAGGGSDSSSLVLRDDSPLVSWGSARFVSSWNWDAARARLDDSGTTWSFGAYAGADAEAVRSASASATGDLYGSRGSRTEAASPGSGLAKSEENGGGKRKAEVLAEASEAGYRGGGERWPEGRVSLGPGLRSVLGSESAVKQGRGLSAASSGSSVMPASSSTLRRLGRNGPGAELLESRV